ncbi:MAG: hypothetical protein LQ348_004457 [Seirophora lacunosa]|nr:MAG: hypothetical protein LQ348_004457 [Seirophora lacunosa]
MQVSGKGKPEGLFIPDWEDERGRLRMWAANIGAHQTGQSSLEFRLRDSSQIQQQIIRLLEKIAVQLRDARTVLTEGENSDVESIIGSDSGDEETLSEIQQLRSSVASLIGCLFEISILVRKPGRHDVRTESKEIDLTAYAWADLRHVRDKFPHADDQITSRLGQAITQRRKYFRYRERHAAKLRQGIDRDDELSEQPSRSETLSETVATSFRHRGGDDDGHGNASVSGFTQTSFASTLISGGIPAAPEASRGGAPFECPYCYCIVTAPSLKTWSRHVFYDLEPYVCIDMDCKTPNRLYTTRHEWLHHMKIAHQQHENEVHVCALCGDDQRDQASLGRHVARHLQELSLFILPRNDSDSDEATADAESDSSSNRSLSASALHQSEQDEPLFVSTEVTVAAGDFGNPAEEVAKIAGRANKVQPLDAASSPASRVMSSTVSDANPHMEGQEHKRQFRMVIHLKDDRQAQRICRLDTSADLDVISLDVFEDLQLPKVKWEKGEIRPLGPSFTPEWQVTFDWHVATYSKTYTSTFAVLPKELSTELDVLIGYSTIKRIGFYKTNDTVW